MVFVFLFYVTLLLLSRKWDELQALTRQGATGQIRGGLANTPDSPKPQKERTMPEDLKKVADLITANTIFCTKEVLTADETARYLGISKSYLYKLTMGKKIPHYKPTGKMCYFNRLELESWLQSNRVATADEIEQKAQNYCVKKGGTL